MLYSIPIAAMYFGVNRVAFIVIIITIAFQPNTVIPPSLLSLFKLTLANS